MNDTKTEFKYFQFPLCLLSETYQDIEKGLNMILDYGVMNFALKLEHNLQDVAKQLVYDYKRNCDVLESRTIKKIEKQNIPDDNELLFSSDGKFNPDKNVVLEPVLKLFESDMQLKQDAIYNYQLHIANKNLKLKRLSNCKDIRGYEIALRIKTDFENNFGPDSMSSCKPDMLIDFRNNQEDIMMFRAYIGLKSLIGKNEFIRTHKTVIISRMMGCKSDESLQNFLKSNTIAKEIYIKYSGRKRMDNLLFSLVERGFIMKHSEKHESGIYISTRHKTHAELAKAILENRTQKANLKKQLTESNR